MTPFRFRFVPNGAPYQLDTKCLDIQNDDLQRQQLFDSLPELLLKGSKAFKTKQEKLLFLYLTITALSGLPIKLIAQYRQFDVRSNLFCVGIGRPASGKGLIVLVQMLLLKVQEHYLKKAANEAKQYKADLAIYKASLKQNSNLPPPQRPSLRVPLIPANCTSAKLIQHLQDNQPDVPQIMIESEIDALVGALEADLVNISTIIRKAFTGEPISISRKTDAEYSYIENSQLAIAMVGTSNQFMKLVNNRSDGLLSRFLVYQVDVPPVVSGLKPCPTCPNLTHIFTKLADDVFDFWKFCSQESFQVELQPHHWEILQGYMDEKLQYILAHYGDDGSQILFRGGLQCFKICMVLSALRKFDTAESSTTITCTDDDFMTALQLVHTSMQYSFEFFEELPDVGLKLKTMQRQKFFDALPDSFTRKEAVAIGKTIHVPESSIDRYLRRSLDDNRLTSKGKGMYQKK